MLRWPLVQSYLNFGWCVLNEEQEEHIFFGHFLALEICLLVGFD